MLVVVAMGVSGCGKSTIGSKLAAALDGDYAEGDAFHPPANVAKMKSGQPLDDTDRQPWLEAMAAAIGRWSRQARPTVLACSALKRAYRDILRTGSPELRFVYLAGDKTLIAARLAARTDHFMPAALLDSQFAALEPPGSDEAITVSIDQPPDAIVAEAVAKLACFGPRASTRASAR
ncbi:gluconokinase [Reyranella sp. CPCC 100927]|uniref:gluconokinase n=1 Tax=Reyranella sp. CPCC 100927 TaxID=2599616 RepID=UPI0011B3EEAF|nr:gluconokinase [Reyranella sp. CPCC 100927]TWT08866.1 gluconokinase [Reyranella sp. CPCC 100927]